MRSPSSILTIVLLIVFLGQVRAQPDARHVDLEVEPLAYAFGGAGGQVGVQVEDWKYEVELFSLEIPESLHGNEGFRASPRGAEVHVEHVFGEESGGLYLGPEAGIVQLVLTHRPSGMREKHVQYSIGVRGGYRWYPGLGNLYVSPVVGASYTLNAGTIDLVGETVETSPVTPWATVGLGWSFSW